MRGYTWAEIAKACGYANAGCAYGSMVYLHADSDEERELLITPPWRQRQLEEQLARREMREGERARTRGMRNGSFQCFSCGLRKPLPSSRCDQCGDDPVSHNGDPREFDRAWGYA